MAPEERLSEQSPAEAVEEAVAEAPDGAAAAAAEADPGGDAVRAVELDLDELHERAQKADEYLDLAQRTRADFENFRKRAAREAGAAEARGIGRLARELFPALDNVQRALDVASGADEHLVAGIRLVQSELLAALARVGIEPFSPDGEPFDPEWHEAMAQQPVEGTASGTVVEVYQQGFRLGEQVLRPARVVVAA